MDASATARMIADAEDEDCDPEETSADAPLLPWPPRSAEEMRAWQAQVGTDLEIALALGLSRATIYGHRMKYGVAALPRKTDKRVREKRLRERTSKAAMRRLYKGRRYEDAPVGRYL